MPKKKTAQKKYFIKDKEVITDPDAPVVSNEFIDKVDGDEYRGQTVEVTSDTKLEADTGIGEPFVLRTFTFALDPTQLKGGLPDHQTLFNSFSRGIEAMLWTDGLAPEYGLPPKLIFTKKRSHLLIMVWAKPRLGQTIAETPKTLSQIISESKPNSNKV